MNRHPLAIHDQRGFSLVELLVAMTILLIGVAGTVAMLDRANARTVENRAREAGTALAREVVERSRSLTYASITSASLPGQLQAMEGLADVDAGRVGWQIERRGVRFDVETSACSVDDGDDKFGVRDGASWCAGAGAPNGDTNPDDYKRITVELTWDKPEAKGRVREQTLVNSPGNSVGPAVTSLVSPQTSTGIVGECQTTCAISTLNFTATTSSTPATVSWSLDGAHRGTATGSGTTWSFPWGIADVTDGSYLVGVRAYDKQGRSGATRVLTIKLNRFKPLKPRGFAAGRNGSIVDVEWYKNTERDIVGYRVYRQVAGQVPEQVGGSCIDPKLGDRTARNSCYDAAPPAGDVVYYVQALDLTNSNEPRLGEESDRVTVDGTSTPPGPVTDVRHYVDDKDGSNRLTWVAPTGSPAPAFYRIYRDGQTFEHRYDRTGSGTEVSWPDPARPDGRTHTYAVTAVSAQLAESAAVQAVKAVPQP